MQRGTRVLGIVLLAAAGILAGAILVVAQGGAAGTLDEQYKARLAKVDRKNTDQLIGLAKWCIQSGLPELATQNALDTLAIAPDDVRAKYILFALQAGAGGETPEGGAASAETGTGPKVTISQKDADAIWTREGDQAMSKFKMQVQGMLLLRCGNAQCHGGNKQAKVQLVREGPGTRRTIAQNFAAISPYIANREKPEDNKLIQLPLKGPEGGHPKKSITSTTDPMYTTLVDWIKGLKKEGDVMWGEIRKQPPPKLSNPEKTPAKPAKTPPKAAEK